MKATFKAGLLTITADNGDTVSRSTKAEYKVAIVGRKTNGKLAVAFASHDIVKAKALFASIPHAARGSVTYTKFYGLSDLALVVVAEENASQEEGVLEASGWLPVDNADAWKEADAALIAKKK